MAILGFLAILVFGVAQFVAGYLGIEHHFGAGWATGVLVVCFLFRFMLPITIGSFFGAMTVWGWHWAFAALFAAPGLLFVIPGVIASVVSMVRK
jgi:hypothetical protein